MLELLYTFLFVCVHAHVCVPVLACMPEDKLCVDLQVPLTFMYLFIFEIGIFLIGTEPQGSTHLQLPS